MNHYKVATDNYKRVAHVAGVMPDHTSLTVSHTEYSGGGREKFVHRKRFLNVQ